MIYREKLKALSSLCDIQTGYTARTRLEPTKGSGVPAIQLRDLRGEDEFDPAGVPLYELAPSIDRYWARPGDVLFRSRGERNTAVLISEKSNSAAVAVLPLMVLRPHREYVDPAYVAWFINQPDTQRYFDKCALGTNMRMIPKDCLHTLEVAVPDLATQRRIVEIDSLARRERALTHELAEKKFELARAAMLTQARQLAQHTTKGK
jgi:hypothetical protein